MGFTLLEVLVALLVVGIGLGAALRLLAVSEDGLWQRQQRMVAGWVAQNRLNALRLGAGGIKQTGTVSMAGQTWRWRLVPDATGGGAGFRRLHITVATATQPARILIDREAVL